MDSSVILQLLVSLTTLLCTASSEPPSRLNLLRFFMGFGPEQSSVRKISFNPEAGIRFREQYEKKYGPRGQLLIERFGQGLAKQGPAVVDVDQVLDVPLKNKTKHYRTYDFNAAKSKVKKDLKIEIVLSSTNSPEDEIPPQ